MVLGVLLVLMSATQAMATGVNAWQTPQGAAYDPDTVLVKFVPGTSRVRAYDIARTVGLTELSYFPETDWYHLRVSPQSTVDETVASLMQNRAVASAQPNYYYWADDVFPSDPQFSYQWGLHNTGQTGGTPDADIDAPEAWAVNTSAAEVVVGVIDSGIDYTHPDLACNMWTNPGEIAGNGLDDDGNGYVDDVYGYDFANNDSDPMDDAGHGTHVAGTIGACTNNGDGVAGVAWSVKLMALKWLDSTGHGTTVNAVRALSYATRMGAKITNNSWGGVSYDVALRDEIANAAASGSLFVASAGNDHADNDAQPRYPSSFDLPNIICVAASTSTDDLSSFSNYGANSVDLAAPGSGIRSTVPGNSYAEYDGTSMATPHVSGVAALVWGAYPSLTYEQTKDRILSSVDPVPALAGKVATGGRLNLRTALGEIPTCDSSSYTTPESAGALADGETVAGLCGETQYYTVTVTSPSTVVWTMVPDSGDFDLYTSWTPEAVPTVSTYDCRPFSGTGQPESCESLELGPGRYYAMVQSFSGSGSYSIGVDVSPVAGPSCDSTSFTTPSSPCLLSDGETQQEMCGSEQYYTVTISQAGTVTWAMTPEGADFDLYTSWEPDVVPSGTAYDCRPYSGSGVQEICESPPLEPGTYYAMVRLYDGVGLYSVSVMTDYSGGPCDDTSFSDPDSAYRMSSGETKADMCGSFQYYAIAVTEPCDVVWTLNPQGGDFDLYSSWSPELVPSDTAYDCRPYFGGDDPEVCSSHVSSAGTYYAMVASYDQAGSYSISVRTISVPDDGFPDLTPQDWGFEEVMACVRAGIVQGYEDGLYWPDIGVTREQMAAYIARAHAGGDQYVPPDSAYPFPTYTDVLPGDPVYKYVEYLSACEVVTGYEGGIYGPHVLVDRGQMPVFISRARGWVRIGDDMTVPSDLYPDVLAGFWSGQAILACEVFGVVTGYEDGWYHPEWTVSRVMMAAYVARAFRLMS
jgi:subtilisin family serine protease